MYDANSQTLDRLSLMEGKKKKSFFYTDPRKYYSSVKASCEGRPHTKAQELCESRGGLTVLMVSVDVKQHRTELRSCVKVEVAVLGSHSLTVLMVSLDVKQH